MPLGLTLLLAAASSADVPIERSRVALVVGQNQGLPEERPLRHAERDADRVRRVLGELGRFDRVLHLAGPSVAELLAALEALPGSPEVLVFYYSGHAGRGALHLQGGLVEGKDVLASLDAKTPGLRVAIIDACESGDLTQSKGLESRIVSPQTLSSRPTQGRVVLASSSPGAAAQESDALEGSYFTAHVVAGLRGAADGDEDGRVTLREVFEHARARTVSDTFLSGVGVQRPSFRLRLDGEADVPLTWIDSAGAQLELGGGASGRYLVQSAEGRLIAELAVARGERSTLSFPPGRYQILKREPTGALVAELSLRPASRSILRDADMERVPFVRVARKGGIVGSYAAGVRLGTGVGGAAMLAGVDLGYTFELGAFALWPSLRVEAGSQDDQQLVAGDLGVLLNWGQSLARWRPHIGLRAALALLHQRNGALGESVTFAPRLELLGGLDAWLSHDLGLFALLGIGLTGYPVQEDPRVDRSEWTTDLAAFMGLGARWR